MRIVLDASVAVAAQRPHEAGMRRPELGSFRS